jgi:DNA-binding GntR family transcriptional regulator
MPRLLRLLEGLWDATETYRPASRLDQRGQAALQTEHQVMLDAFLAGDEQRLADATDQHRRHLFAAALLGKPEASSFRARVAGEEVSDISSRPPLDRPGLHS